MNNEDLRNYIRNLTVEQYRDSARLALLQEDEVIVSRLIDEFYAGVSVVTGAALLNVIGEIGGYEAIALLDEVYHDLSTKQIWREIAERWLRVDGFL
ncbi:MAG: hypothetical protein MUF87_01840 [Anaerolineae bacterium]|jgi:hypothetical protein|nr:hypothetical protein [Anaerolineae bacterium]